MLHTRFWSGRRGTFAGAALVAVLCACNEAKVDRARAAPQTTRPLLPPPVTVTPPVTTASTPTPLVSAGRQLMGTWFELKVAGATDAAHARAALERGLDEIARLEDVLSEWRPHTEISKINANAGGKAIPVGPDTRALLRIGLDISRRSEGAFDLSWAAVRDYFKFEPGTPPVVPEPREIRRLLGRVGYESIVFDEDASTVRLARPGMAIGTGGIGKGYALDRVAGILLEAGYPNHLLFAGGQVQVHGQRDGRPWRIGIKHPRREGAHIGFFELEDGSVSTSGDYEHYFVHEGRLYHHIVDPKTGYPATRSVSVTLVAPDGSRADALSTACFVMGPARCIPMLERTPGAPQAVIIDPELRVHVTKGLEGRVKFNPPLVDGKLADARPH